MSDDRFELGLEQRIAVLGSDHVARAEANATEFDADFQRFITEYVWGSIWSRPGLDQKTRHMLTIAMLACMNRTEELALHIRSTKQTGISASELREVLMQV